MVLELGDLAGDRRLRGRQIARHGREGAGFDDPGEGAKERDDIRHSYILRIYFLHATRVIADT